MTWWQIILLIVMACFAGVLLFGAPYLPTLKPQIKSALQLAALKPGQTLIELGCGDGRVVIAAARQGLNVIGYELNPLLAIIAWIRTRHYRRQVKIVWGNFWRQPWPPAEAIFTFLLPRYMPQLDRHIRHRAAKPVKLVSFAFEIPRRKPDKVKNGLYLYRYD